MPKITPSQDIRLAWLAGIIDGEGSISNLDSNRKSRYYRVTIVNTDNAIIKKVEEIYSDFGIKYRQDIKEVPIDRKPFRKACYAIMVERRDDVYKLLFLIEPLLIGGKKKRAGNLKRFLEDNPRIKIRIYCDFCGREIRDFWKKERKKSPAKKMTFCNLTCWHKFAVGTNNPYYKNGKYIGRKRHISGVTTKQEPLLKPMLKKMKP